MDINEIRDRLIGATLATSYENGGFTKNVIVDVQEKAGGYSIYLEGCAACLYFSAERTETLAHGTTISDSGCLFHLEEGRKTKIIDWETYRIYVGSTIFWWSVTRERADELAKYYKSIYPTKSVTIVKNEKDEE